MAKMKQLIIILLFASCQKYNATLISWHGYYITDTVTASSMAVAKSMPYDCPGDVKVYADTVLDYNRVPPEQPQTAQEIHAGLMQHISDPVQISPGVWQRRYYTFTERIK